MRLLDATTASYISDMLKTIFYIFVLFQLDDDKIQYLIRWLPEKLSPNVRVVVSMIDETECHRLLRSYKTGPKEIVCGELDYSSRKVGAFSGVLSFGVRCIDDIDIDRQTDRRTDGWTDRRTDEGTDRQTDRRTDGCTGGERFQSWAITAICFSNNAVQRV